MDTGPTFWQKLATRSQSNLYFALLFLPKERREAFRDVYRFLRAADDVADSDVPPDVARRALGEWRRELEVIYSGSAASGHPIAVRLSHTVRRYNLSRGHFETILTALWDDVAPRGFESFAALSQWCEAMSSTLGYLCLEILGASGPGSLDYARQVGIALQLANIVRDVAEDADRGRLYLPTDELTEAGCRPEDVLACRFSPAFSQVASLQAQRARNLVEEARRSLTRAQKRELLVPEIWADVYLAQLAELEAVQFDVLTTKRPPYLRRRRKVAIAMGRWLKHWRFDVP